MSYKGLCLGIYTNLLSVLLRYGTRPYEWGTHRDSNLLMEFCLSCLEIITPPEVPSLDIYSFDKISGFMKVSCTFEVLLVNFLYYLRLWCPLLIFPDICNFPFLQLVSSIHFVIFIFSFLLYAVCILQFQIKYRNVFKYIHTHTYIYIYIHTHKYIYIYICVCVCVY